MNFVPLNCNNKSNDDVQESEVEAAMKTILEEGAAAVGPNQSGVAQNPLDGVVVVMGQAQKAGCDRQTTSVAQQELFWIFF